MQSNNETEGKYWLYEAQSIENLKPESLTLRGSFKLFTEASRARRLDYAYIVLSIDEPVFGTLDTRYVWVYSAQIGRYLNVAETLKIVDDFAKNIANLIETQLIPALLPIAESFNQIAQDIASAFGDIEA